MAPCNSLHSFHYPPVNRRMIQFGFYLTSIGSICYQKNTSYPVAGHPDSYKFEWDTGRTLHDYVLILIGAGGGVFESEKIPLTRVRAGDAIYLVPGEWHRYRPHRSTGWSERWICLNGSHLHQLRKSAIISDGSELLKPSQSETASALLEGLLKEAVAEPKINKPSWSTRALEILLHILEESDRPDAAHISLPHIDQLVNRARRYIQENSHRPLTVGLVAASCHTVRRTLERHFAANGRHSVAREILSCRIERAESLLKESQLPIKEIAFACGFATPQRMISSFRRYCGCTPSSLRGGRI